MQELLDKRKAAEAGAEEQEGRAVEDVATEEAARQAYEAELAEFGL